jgi:hypothetical protein
MSLLFILILSQFSMAETAEKSKKSEGWKGGWSFLAGIGATAARTITNTDSERAMLGPNISTSVGYCTGLAYCIEIGSMTSANFYESIKVKTQGKEVDASVIMWESSYYLSTRIAVPGIKPTNLFHPGFKLLVGYGNTVSFIREVDDQEISQRDGLRIHNEGPLMGAAFILMFNAMDDSYPWFIEVASILQLHWKSYVVQPQGVVPVVLDQSFTEENTRIMRLNLSVGIPLFY